MTEYSGLCYDPQSYKARVTGSIPVPPTKIVKSNVSDR